MGLRPPMVDESHDGGAPLAFSLAKYSPSTVVWGSWGCKAPPLCELAKSAPSAAVLLGLTEPANAIPHVQAASQLMPDWQYSHQSWSLDYGQTRLNIPTVKIYCGRGHV